MYWVVHPRGPRYFPMPEGNLKALQRYKGGRGCTTHFLINTREVYIDKYTLILTRLPYRDVFGDTSIGIGIARERHLKFGTELQGIVCFGMVCAHAVCYDMVCGVWHSMWYGMPFVVWHGMCCVLWHGAGLSLMIARYRAIIRGQAAQTTH